MSDLEILETQIKDLIIELLGRTDLQEHFDSDAALLSDAIGLDSMDVLEILQTVQDRYDVDLNIGTLEIRKSFGSVHGIAELLQRSGVTVG